jgi:outer membrane lipoprotein SlyB
MIKKISTGLLAAAVLLFFAGCETVKEHKGAAVGAGIGGAAGAALGDDNRVLGGLIGALVGGAIGHYAYDQQRSGEETAEVYDYSPDQGTRLEIENAAVQPITVEPGQKVDIKMTYAVLNPSEEEQLRVTEIREISHNGEQVGRLEKTVTHSDGTYTSSVPIQLPSDAEQGLYEVKTKIQTPRAQAVELATFSVR